MSTIKADAITAVTADTPVTITGAGTGKVRLGDANLLWPDADGSSSGDVLQTNGSGTLSFATPAAGAWSLITTATPSAATEVAFTSLSSAYKIYRFVFTSLTFASVAEIRMRTSTDNGSSYASSNGDYDYSNTSMAPLGSTFTTAPIQYSFAGATATTSQYMRLMYQFAATSGSGMTGGELTMYNPSNTTIYKTSSWNMVGAQDTPLMYNSLGFGSRNSAAAIDAVKFYVASGNFSGNIYLYGLT